MSPELSFTKMSGAGNDFVLIAGEGSLPPASLAKRLCPRRTAVGADGLLLLKKGKGPGRVRMAYFNSDGSRAFCGNGARCAAWWAHQAGWGRGKKILLESDQGLLEARVTGKERVRIRMPEVKVIERDKEVEVDGRTFFVHWIFTGVPHVVVMVKDLEKAPVESWGRILRYHKAFRPEGANVNFIQRKGAKVLVRTYERGVEAETLACGTGAVASACAAQMQWGMKSTVSCLVRSGDNLKVSLEKGLSGRRAFLEGPAKIVFEGEIYV